MGTNGDERHTAHDARLAANAAIYGAISPQSLFPSSASERGHRAGNRLLATFKINTVFAKRRHQIVLTKVLVTPHRIVAEINNYSR